MAMIGSNEARFPARTRVFLAVSFLVASVAVSSRLSAAQPVPPILQVPSDNGIAWRAAASGSITYECSITPDSGEPPRWRAVKAEAELGDGKAGNSGVYSSPPETWKASDGSSLTGMEVVRANVGPDRLYDQLVLANPSRGAGLLTGVTYIQRLVSSGGAAPSAERCTMATLKQRERVGYHAEYVFWKPQ
ncbi:MAG: DUF3455 domain-containing protein [Achromobacter sp.]|uniref:DUF3455 domain-containing protein n=1 Tax=Achromobacter sp. TaxID=134375 RepID=UPI003D05BD2A